MTGKNLATVGTKYALKFLHSVVDPTSLADELTRIYELDAPLRCHLYLRGVNDTYHIISSIGEDYAVRLSLHDWKSEADLAYEISLLCHLADSGIRVPRPQRAKDGRFIHSLETPEGERHFAMFTWLPGRPQRSAPTVVGARAFGREMARCHIASLTFKATEPHALHLADELETYTHCLEQFLRERKSDYDFVFAAIRETRRRILGLECGLQFGPCHGDVHSGNALEDVDGAIGILDFDVCGEWYQCFDVASFLWSVELFGWSKKISKGFLNGYECERCLSGEERRTLPLLMMARDAWHLITWARNASALGCEWFHEHRLEQRMKLFRLLASKGLG